MNLLQNKRKRDETGFTTSKNFPDINNKTAFRLKNPSTILNNIDNIFFFKNKIKNKLNNQINIEPGNKEKKISENNYFDFGYFNNERLRIFLMPSSFQIENFMNLEEFKNNNFVQVSHVFEDNINNINEKNKVKVEQNLKKGSDENKNIIFNNQKINSLEHIINNINNNKKQTHFSIKKEVKIIKPPQNTSNQIHPLNGQNISQNTGGIFTTKNISEINKKKSSNGPNSSLGIIETSKPFQTFNAKYFSKSSQSLDKSKLNQVKIFHIEKIFNKKEYRDANEKDSSSEDKNLKNRFKISLKKIKQIFMNSCLKIYLFNNDKFDFSENKLNDESYLNQITQQVYDIIKSKKINSSRMNEILQVNDDDKYRKHYFMFSSEAKQFCLDLINIKNLSFDIVMKMCKVPRKSLRRWSHVGCNRKKGCGRKTRNPEIENKLVEWYKEEIGGGANVSAKMIRDKAVEISGDKDFLASKGWLEKFKKKFGIRIATHKNKNFKKIISFKEKIGKINDNISYDEKDKENIKYQEDDDSKNNYDIGDIEQKKISEKESDNSDNDAENEEDKNENLDDNENNNDNNGMEQDDENGVNINIVNNDICDENEKNDERKNKINDNIISLRKPIFTKTKIDKGNNKKFNIFKLNTVC